MTQRIALRCNISVISIFSFVYGLQTVEAYSDCGLTKVLYASVFISLPGRVAQSVGHLTRKSGVLGSIPGLATYFRFSYRFFKKGSYQLLANVCARSTG